MYSFFINETEITGNIRDVLNQESFESEKVVEIVYQPQAIFRVRAVSRCTSTISGMCRVWEIMSFLLYIIPQVCKNLHNV